MLDIGYTQCWIKDIRNAGYRIYAMLVIGYGADPFSEGTGKKQEVTEVVNLVKK